MEWNCKKLRLSLRRCATYVFFVVLFEVFFSGRLVAQIFPVEGSKLHYRITRLFTPERTKAAGYIFEIARGNYNTDDSFQKNIIITLTSKKNTTIAEVPSFGAQYTWRVRLANAAPGGIKNELHHFSTGIIPNVDTNVSRLRILKSSDLYKDAYVFVDGQRTLYDMSGHPVWYLPALPGFSKEKLRDLRDLKLSPMGTITFLLDQQAYEINYDGDILWKGPNTGVVSGNRVEHYHHEFTRLANGHYMVLGDEHVLWQLRPSNDSALMREDKVVWDKTNNTLSQKMTFGTLIEYDEHSNVVWSWKSSGYFKTSDLYTRKTPTGLYDIDTHENSFFFDEKDKAVYISFRNISRVVKVSYPDGKVIGVYGSIFQPGQTSNDKGLFCYQHSCRRSQSGYLYLFDNNSCNPGSFPEILMMKEPSSDKEKISTVWDFECNNEVRSDRKQTGDQYTTGGNVIELPGSALFVSMCSGYSQLFIVNMEKKVLWSAIPEKWDANEKSWQGTTQYRASMINNRSELDKLVFNTGKK